MALQIFVAQAEMVIAKKQVFRIRRWVAGNQNQIVFPVDHLAFDLGILAPEHIDNVLTITIQSFNYGVGEFFPTLSFVRSRGASGNS